MASRSPPPAAIDTSTQAALKQAGFELVVETCLGQVRKVFGDFALHSFPSSLNARKLWGTNGRATQVASLPAYDRSKCLKRRRVGIAQVASGRIAVPFDGLTAAPLGISETPRRLRGGVAIEVRSGSVPSLAGVESVSMNVAFRTMGFTYASKKSDLLPSAPRRGSASGPGHRDPFVRSR